MNMTMNELEQYFKDHYYARYEREHWDRYVAKTGLSLLLPAIHITGTNGKGTTASYIASIYRAAGYRVGIFTTPSFYRSNEIIKLGEEEITDDDFVRLFLEGKKDFEKYDLSSFEIQVAIAYRYFNEKKPDIAVIEVGMGGLLDATNIITPILSIVTSVSLEHTAFLGRTVSEIASAKGGIIKQGVPVLTGKLEETAEATLREIARRHKSPYFVVDDYHNSHLTSEGFRFDYRPYQNLLIATPANYQLKNASLALEATKILHETFPVKEEDVRRGLLAPPPICRLEKHGNIWIDGAHNPEAVEALMGCWGTISEGKPVHVVFAAFRDKNIALELPMIGKEAADITLTTFDHPRARVQEDYFLYEADYPFDPDYREAIKNDMTKYPDDIILVTGSLSFAGIARRYIIEELKK